MSYFGSVEGAMLSLYKATTNGDDWSLFYNVLQPTGWFNTTGYLFFIAFTQVAFINIISALFIEKALKLAQPDRDRLALELRKEQIKQVEELTTLCNDLDKDKNGTIDAEQFQTMLNNSHKVRSYFNVMGLDIKDASTFLSTLVELGDGGEVEISAFVEGCMKMRGTATSLDLQTLAYETRQFLKMQRRFSKHSHRKLSHQLRSVEALVQKSSYPVPDRSAR